MEQPSNAELTEQLGATTGTFAAKLGEVSTSAMKADHQGQMDYVAYIQALSNIPNISFEQVEALMGGFGELRRHMEMPVLPAVAEGRLGFESVDMDFSMAIGAHTTHVKDTEGTVKTGAEASGGGLLWKAKVTMSAEVRHQDKQTRATDMTASVNVKAGMRRQALPEGIASVVDSAIEFSRNANEINKMITGAKVAQIKDQIESGDFDPDATVEAASGPAGTGGGSQPAGGNAE